MDRHHLSRIAGCIVIACMLCGCAKKKAKDIVVSELETACDHVDAMNLVADEMIETLGSGEPIEVSNLSELSAILKLTQKIDEIDDAARKKFSRSEAEACPGWEELQQKSGQLRSPSH